MTVATIITKLPIPFGKNFGPFVLRELDTYGFGPLAHKIRTDFAMWLRSLLVIIKAGGGWSIDYNLSPKSSRYFSS